MVESSMESTEATMESTEATMESTEATIVQPDQIRKGISALNQYMEKTGNKSAFLSDSSTIHLAMCVKKIPKVKNKIIKVLLPHSQLPTPTDVCLFTRDINKKDRDYGPTERHFQSLLQQNGVTVVTKILPLKAIKLEYQPFEAKRNLSDMHDVYLADANIVRLLPGFLGKHFYGRKRFPLQINLDSKNLKNEFEKVLRTTQCIVSGKGSMFGVNIGHTGMSEDELTENIDAVVQRISSLLPGGQQNIRNIHIKTTHSPSIPLHVSFGGADEVELPARQKRKVVDDPQDVDTVIGAKVRITPFGRIDLIGEAGKRVEPNEDGEMTPVVSDKVRQNNSAKKPKKNISAKTKKAKTKKRVLKAKNVSQLEKETNIPKKKKKTLKVKKEALINETVKLKKAENIITKKRKAISDVKQPSTQVKKTSNNKKSKFTIEICNR